MRRDLEKQSALIQKKNFKIHERIDIKLSLEKKSKFFLKRTKSPKQLFIIA